MVMSVVVDAQSGTIQPYAPDILQENL